MEYLTTPDEIMSAREEILEAEKELKKQKREINAERERLAQIEKRLAEKEKDFNPYARLAMTIIAQIFGLVLLVLLTFLSFQSWDSNISYGFDFIGKVTEWYLIASFIIPALAAIIMGIKRRFGHGYVDFILLSYVACDTFFLLLLAYQQGGLCRTMFLPVFFLIPTAYLIAERRDKKYRLRRLLILAGIVGCVCLSYRVSIMLKPETVSGMLKPVGGWIKFLWWSIPVTDFFTLAHPSYDHAVFYASLTSASVPIIQILLGWFIDRLSADESGNTISTELGVAS
jgi:hypothetical protein